MTANPAMVRGLSLRTELRVIAETDLPDVARFIARQSGRQAETVEAHLRWFLLENPCRQPQHPLGFGLRFSDELVGCILCCPQLFTFQGKQILLMGSSSFYVDESHRGEGGRIFLTYCRLGNRWPLFGTSANAAAAGLWKAAGAAPIPYADGELFGVIRWSPVVEELLHRRNPNPTLLRLAIPPAARIAAVLMPLKIKGGEPGELHRLTAPEQVMELPIQGPSQKLTAQRDLPYIRWRYFSGRDASTAVYAFRCRKLGKDILVSVNQRPRGYRAQIETLNLLDVYPEVAPDAYLRIVAALLSSYGESVDAVVLRSQDAVRQKVLRASGFRWRQFDAPNGWFLDKSNLLPTRDWYFVPADGDGLI
jgi:hypothetical protein